MSNAELWTGVVVHRTHDVNGVSSPTSTSIPVDDANFRATSENLLDALRAFELAPYVPEPGAAALRCAIFRGLHFEGQAE